MRLPVDIDGSRGEGGGQVLRTALALSIVTGRRLRMKRIRAGRKRPGLHRQHLACVEAAARLCGGATSALELGAQDLTFTPGSAWPSELAIDIGSAGSAMLVVQTILVPAIAAGKPVRATITGGTHNPLSPPFDFLDRVFLPRLRAMGGDVALALDRHGVIPDGGGQVTLEVRPGGALRPIEIVEGGAVVGSRAIAIVASLPRHIAERELAVARERLGDPRGEIVELRDCGPTNLFMAEVELASGARELCTAHGRKGYPAEDVADDALDDLEDYLDAGAPVGEMLADQLLLPMAVAGGGRFRTAGPLSDHATTNIDTIRAFLDVPIRIEPVGDSALLDVIVG
ncbi:MAG TPA: RNA 3'-terminal phosphate cyclase [Kofleriaceae bacterium]|nr:RNA 3'-terminal phosphate cyclase [Kofleriaceae bacterium]